MPAINRRLFAGGLAAMGAIGTAQAGAAIRLPYIYEDARLYLRARVGSGGWGAFILDTGAAHCGIDLGYADKAGVRARSHESVAGAGPGQSQIGTKVKAVFDLGAAQLPVSEANIIPLDRLLAATTGRHVAGIVGAELFQTHVVEIDPRERKVTLHDPSTFQGRQSAIVVPLTFQGPLPAAIMRLRLPDGGRVDARVLVDLGAKSTLLLSEPFIEAKGLRRAFPVTYVTGLGAGLGGDTHYAFARAQGLEFADAPAASLWNPVVGLSVGGALRSSAYDGLLGAEFLTRYRIFMDYSRHRMLLEPASRSPAPDVDMSGMFLAAEGPQFQRIVVRNLAPGSPAALHGVLPGDAIEAVDGASAARLGLAAVRARLRSEPGAIVALRTCRDNRCADKIIRLRRLV